MMNARIKIDAKKIGQDKINPYIFGHFVEDIRDHMDAMLSYSLKFMDFEEEDVKIKGVSGCWYPVTNGRNTVYDLEPAAPLHSGHSQKIKIYSDDGCYGGIAQKISVKGNMDYNIKIYARASMDINKAYIEVVDINTREVLGKVQVELCSHNWCEYKANIWIYRDCNDAEFRITISSEIESWRDSTSTGTLWLDHISMIPSDSVGNIKREVVEMTKQLNACMMRISGNYISAYHWQNGVGPEYLRPNMVNEVWGGWTSKYFGTDEFLDFCRELSVEPMICVNAGSGTPQEAAEWVEYCNGSKETSMGALRASNGNEKPYEVKYWEVGNEMYGPWQVGHCNAKEYAERYLEFYKAMKKVDPAIKLLACGHMDPEWNKTVLDIAGEYIDYLTIHIYHSYRNIGIQDNASREEKYKGIVCFPEVTRHIIEKTVNFIKNSVKYNQVKLAITEYNTMYFPNTVRKGLPNEHTLEAAVANAANLNEYLRNCDMVQIGSFSDLVNGWLGGCIRVGDYYADQFRGKERGWSGKNLMVYGTPTYYVMKLYANRDIAYIVGSCVECSTFDVSANRNELKNLPIIDVVSCINEKKDKLTVFVVNRDLNDVELTIEVKDFNIAGNIKVWIITGNDIYDINSVFEPEKITLKNCEVNNHSQDNFKYTLNAHSIYAFEFVKKK